MSARFAAILRRCVERLRHRADPDGIQHVAVMCDWFLRYGVAQAVGIRSCGATVTLYYVDRYAEFGDSAEERERYLADARAVGVETRSVPRRSVRRLLRDINWLARDLRQRSIECLVTQAHYDLRFAAISLKYPTALVLHDPRPHSGEEGVLPRRGRAMARFVEATATCVFIHSERLRSQLRPFLDRHEILVIPHGATPRAEPMNVPQSRELLLLGRLYPYKGVDIAIDAVVRARARRPDIRLTIAGNGPLLGELRGQLPEGIELLDAYVPDDVVDALLSRTRLMLLPYRDATQSGVGLLSAAVGLPCVVTAEGGLPDLIPPKYQTDFVVPADDAQALAEAIERTVDHDVQVRIDFLEHVKTTFAWPVVGRRLLEHLVRLDLLEHALPSAIAQDDARDAGRILALPRADAARGADAA